MSRKSRAQDNLVDFLKLFVPDLIVTDTHKNLYRLLEETLTTGCKAVSVNVAPRVGKSSSVIHSLAWAYGNSLLAEDIDLHHMIYSYGLALSTKHELLWKSIVKSPQYHAVFGNRPSLPCFSSPESIGSGVAAGSAVNGSKYRGLIVFDDMVKQLTRDPLPLKTVNWYASVAAPRVQKNYGMLNIGTRFGVQDFTGMLRTTVGEFDAETNPEGYKFVNFPALVNGETAYPNFPHLTTSRLLKLRDSASTYETFQTVYQGCPEASAELSEPLAMKQWVPTTVLSSFYAVSPSTTCDTPTGIAVLAVCDDGQIVVKNCFEIWTNSVTNFLEHMSKLNLPETGVTIKAGLGFSCDAVQVPVLESRVLFRSVAKDLNKVVVSEPQEQLFEQLNNFGTKPNEKLAEALFVGLKHRHKMFKPDTVRSFWTRLEPQYGTIL